MKVFFSPSLQTPRAYMWVPVAGSRYFGPLEVYRTGSIVNIGIDFSSCEAVPEEEIPTCHVTAPVLKNVELENEISLGSPEDSESFRSTLMSPDVAAFIARVFQQVVESDGTFQNYEKHRNN